MRLRINPGRLLCSFAYQFKRYGTNTKFENVDIEKIRNIGILAHIDAGKTTTTERMLFYGGIINHMGEVHHGNTVTDYMAQERERGITITSAAVTFYWRKNQFNLVDTPGHIDFTMEVEQSLNVLDGAVIVLDGSAGVEAQTHTVWRQACRYKIPKIVFVNKMDRIDSNIKMCCESIEDKLGSECLLLQLPLRENEKLVGIIDLLSMEIVNYGTLKDKQVKRLPLTEESFPQYWNEAQLARSKLIDKLTNYNDDLANTVIASNTLDSISSVDVIKALQDVTFKQTATPVLLGSAYKNIGVQSLMDSVILYLPSPKQRNEQFLAFEDNFCARAFKVVHDRQKGPLVFLRIYNGELSKGQKIYSIQRECSEQIGRLYMAFADEFKEVDNVKNGNIGVVAGLKKVMSGDLVTNSHSASQKAKKNILKVSARTGIEGTEVEKLLGMDLTVPEPVFFCSIEPPSMAFQTALEQSLTELQREDPSLRVTYDAESGQTVLGGMGELHLEIIKDRILKEYKVDAELGPLQIAYREIPLKKLTDSVTVETKMGNSKQFITVKLSLIPVDLKHVVKDVIKLDKSPDSSSNISSIFPKHLLAIRQGINVAFLHGPKINSPVVNSHVMLHWAEIGRGTSESMISATVTQLVQKLLRESGTEILEPLMHLEVVCPEEHLSTVMMDLSRRRTAIRNVTIRGKAKMVIADAPLSELLGYSTILRTLTSGTGSFTMEFNKYERMSSSEEGIAITNVRGF